MELIKLSLSLFYMCDGMVMIAHLTMAFLSGEHKKENPLVTVKVAHEKPWLY